MIILNYAAVEFVAANGNTSHHEQLDTFLMQWFNSSDSLKSLLIAALDNIYNQVNNANS